MARSCAEPQSLDQRSADEAERLSNTIMTSMPVQFDRALLILSFVAAAVARPLPPSGARSRAGSSSTASRPSLPPLDGRQGPVLHRQQARRTKRSSSARTTAWSTPSSISSSAAAKQGRGSSRLRRALKKPVVLDNKGCSFEPHIVAVRTGQPLDDQELRSGRPQHEHRPTCFNETIRRPAKSGSRRRQGRSRCPMPVSCNIHPFMKGHVLLLRIIRTWPCRARTARSKSRTSRPASTSFSSGTKRGYLKDLKLKGGATDRQRPGQAHDRAGRDARPGRHQGPGEQSLIVACRLRDVRNACRNEPMKIRSINSLDRCRR